MSRKRCTCSPVYQPCKGRLVKGDSIRGGFFVFIYLFVCFIRGVLISEVLFIF